MKIRSQIPSAKAGSALSAKGTAPNSQARFSKVLDQSRLGPAEEVTTVAPVMEGLSELSSKMQEGEVTKEEASRLFVGIVIKHHNLKKHMKNANKVESLIADVVEQDPCFTKKLEAQLKKINLST